MALATLTRSGCKLEIPVLRSQELKSWFPGKKVSICISCEQFLLNQPAIPFSGHKKKVIILKGLQKRVQLQLGGPMHIWCIPVIYQYFGYYFNLFPTPIFRHHVPPIPTYCPFRYSNIFSAHSDILWSIYSSIFLDPLSIVIVTIPLVTISSLFPYFRFPIPFLPLTGICSKLNITTIFFSLVTFPFHSIVLPI